MTRISNNIDASSLLWTEKIEKIEETVAKIIKREGTIRFNRQHAYTLTPLHSLIWRLMAFILSSRIGIVTISFLLYNLFMGTSNSLNGSKSRLNCLIRVRRSNISMLRLIKSSNDWTIMYNLCTCSCKQACINRIPWHNRFFCMAMRCIMADTNGALSHACLHCLNRALQQCFFMDYLFLSF